MTTSYVSLQAWTDGAVSGNPGPGGWAVLLDGQLISGWVPQATNNEMELYAIYQALLECPPNVELVIFTDSKVAIGWLGRGWKVNQPAIAGLLGVIRSAVEAKNVALFLEKTKGHASDENNRRVDRAASGQTVLARHAFLLDQRHEPAGV